MTTNPMNDPSSPFYMHPNENPGIMLVSVPLTGKNYHNWSKAMSMALKTKNKLQFIDGTLPKPSPDQPLFPIWDRCNTLVLSWINQTLDPSIAPSVLWLETVYEDWNDLKERYYQGDEFRICELQEELYGMRQGNLSIDAYYTQLKNLWQELDNFRPIPSCLCEIKCHCHLIPIIKSYRENDYVIRFLKGLNEQYSAVRSQIILMQPLPSINKAFSFLMQQERQMNLPFEDPRILANNSDESYGRGRVRGKGYTNGPSGFTGRGRGYAGRGNNNKICTFCNRSGHTIDVCYRKHGFPPSFKLNSNGNINNVTSLEQSIDVDQKVTDKDQKEEGIKTFMPFTLDQQQAIMSMMKQHNNQPSHITNQMSSNPSGKSFCFQFLRSRDWILDTGATDHVCYTLSQFQSFNHIQPITVKLLDGSEVITSISGSVLFSNHLYLSNVLYIPKFSFNIISISKLTSALDCKLVFSKLKCLIQDQNTLKMIGVA
ncbi:PREDICTED: uncharacterized protein LOC109332489 [Lupinus angustifolius]|uniref:uncharacterized protein LOC109332489 n=1 Tax=Lupinus angustifolius TaxID=3871 RepID=UPI00092E4E16|nr:PREDICTED: uncharacterized protein LOC109332489 [Lupinus angustifolius]